MTTVEQARLADSSPDLSGDQARAERAAADRRHRRQWINLAIRLVSLASALALWEVAAWKQTGRGLRPAGPGTRMVEPMWAWILRMVLAPNAMSLSAAG